MTIKTRQDHIDPLVLKIQKCGAPGCKPNSVQVIFTRPQGFIKDFEPVWACSSGHCSDYDQIPILRRPELDPVAWFQANAIRAAALVGIQICYAHSSMQSNHPGERWGMEGHLWVTEDDPPVIKLCLPMTVVDDWE